MNVARAFTLLDVPWREAGCYHGDGQGGYVESGATVVFHDFFCSACGH